MAINSITIFLSRNGEMGEYLKVLVLGAGRWISTCWITGQKEQDRGHVLPGTEWREREADDTTATLASTCQIITITTWRPESRRLLGPLVRYVIASSILVMSPSGLKTQRGFILVVEQGNLQWTVDLHPRAGARGTRRLAFPCEAKGHMRIHFF